MFDNVIVGADGAEGGRDALWLAQQLASPDAQLTLAHVEVVTPKPGPTSAAISQADRDRLAIRRLALLREEAHVDAQLLCVEAASVAAGLRELVARHQADVLAIGASRRDDYERTFVGDDVHAVLENAPCPVAIAPRRHASRAPALGKIGAGYDGSAESEQALALARVLARERGAELSAFQAVPQPGYVHSLVNPQPEIEAGLAEARARIAEHGDVEAHAASSDDAAEALARYGASVDLLVLGSHRYRPVDHLLSGSTAQRLADDAPCPLLVLATR
jgi:nucleotide-binding universal stress UspA family protein